MNSGRNNGNSQLSFGHNKANLRKHLNQEKIWASNRFKAVKIGNETIYSLIRDPNIGKVGKFLSIHGNKNINPPGANSRNFRTEFYFANGLRGVHKIATSYLTGAPVNKSRWVDKNDPPGVKQTSNSFKIHNPVPVIAYNKEGRYVGHVWREGAPPSVTGSKTAKFIGIQKTLNPNVKVAKFAPALLKQVEAELGELGYTRMATFPRRIMARILHKTGTWPPMDPKTSLITKTIGRNYNRENQYRVNKIIPPFRTLNNLMNNSKFSRKNAETLLKQLQAIQTNYPRRNSFIGYLTTKLSRPAN